jgi:hypothetical protein
MNVTVIGGPRDGDVIVVQREDDLPFGTELHGAVYQIVDGYLAVPVNSKKHYSRMMVDSDFELDSDIGRQMTARVLYDLLARPVHPVSIRVRHEKSAGRPLPSIVATAWEVR